MAKRRPQSDRRPARPAGVGLDAAAPAGLPRWVPSAVAAAALVLLVAVTFGRLFDAGFTTWDDRGTLTENPWFNPPNAAGLSAAWTKPNMDLWVPVTYTVWWLTAQAAWAVDAVTGQGSLTPAPFHALNVLLHAGSACLVLALLRRLRFPLAAAAIGAAVFAAHPVQVESVGWTSGMKDVLFGLLSLGMLYAYVAAVDGGGGVGITDNAEKRTDDLPPRPPSPRAGRTRADHRRPGFPRPAPLAAAVLLLAAAVMAKPTAVVLPAMAFAVDWLLVGRRPRAAAATALPLFALVLPFAYVAKQVQDVVHDDGGGVPLASRPLVAADAVAFYFGKLLAPIDLCVDYGRSPAAANARGYLAWTWAFPVAAAVAAGWAWARWRARVPAAALALFVLGMAPVLGFVAFDFQNLSTVTDHYLYLPLFGVAVLVAWGLSAVPGFAAVAGDAVASARPAAPRPAKAAVAWAAALAVVVALAARSFDQARHWHDTRSLFERALAVNPDSSAALNSLAALAVEEGRAADAVRLGERALAVRPFDAPTLISLGSAYLAVGRQAEALDLYRRAYARKPDDPVVLSSLAGALGAQRQFAEALPLAERAVALYPHVARAQLNLGTLLVDLGRVDEGLGHLAEVVRIEPRNVPARIQSGVALARTGRPAEAAGQFEAALRVDPSNDFAGYWLRQLRNPSGGQGPAPRGPGPAPRGPD